MKKKYYALSICLSFVALPLPVALTEECAETMATPQETPPPGLKKAAWEDYPYYYYGEMPLQVALDYYHYLREKYAGWDYARAEEEVDRIREIRQKTDTSTEEEIKNHWELINYLDVAEVPPDPRKITWHKYSLTDSLCIPLHVWEDYYQYLLERYADWGRVRAEEEIGRLSQSRNNNGRMHYERERRCNELGDYIAALRRQYLREKYADMNLARAKEEAERLTNISEGERSLTDEERERHKELVEYTGVNGVLRREYLLTEFVGWDIARAEAEIGRIDKIRGERSRTNEEFARHWNLTHYVEILRELQPGPKDTP